MRNEGRQTYAPPRQPKPHGPEALAGASLGAHGGSAVRRLPAARFCRWPRSGGQAFKPEREGSLKSNDHRGLCGASFKHRARDAGELADLRFDYPDGASSKSIVPLRCCEVPKPAGPSRTRRPARPSLSGCALANLGRETRRENEGGRLKKPVRSFPRKRESRAKNWVPAFAGDERDNMRPRALRRKPTRTNSLSNPQFRTIVANRSYAPR
jgi:hypothetical protein